MPRRCAAAIVVSSEVWTLVSGSRGPLQVGGSNSRPPREASAFKLAQRAVHAGLGGAVAGDAFDGGFQQGDDLFQLGRFGFAEFAMQIDAGCDADVFLCRSESDALSTHHRIEC